MHLKVNTLKTIHTGQEASYYYTWLRATVPATLIWRKIYPAKINMVRLQRAKSTRIKHELGSSYQERKHNLSKLAHMLKLIIFQYDD